MLTEKEAFDTKWCPALVPIYVAKDKTDWEGRCFGSSCMAWRWEDNRHERGFCGMAGKPVVP